MPNTRKENPSIYDTSHAVITYYKSSNIVNLSNTDLAMKLNKKVEENKHTQQSIPCIDTKLNNKSTLDHMITYTMETFSLRSGIRKFGQKDHDLDHKKVKKIHDYETFKPRFVHDLIKEKRKGALRLLIFLKENSIREIKFISCIDESPHRATTKK